MPDYNKDALRAEAQELSFAEQKLWELKRQFADRYSNRLRAAFDVLEFIEQNDDDYPEEVQAYGGFELFWDRSTGYLDTVRLYSNVSLYDEGDYQHEHYMDFVDFCECWDSWYAEKDELRTAIQRIQEEETNAAWERARASEEEAERAEYERLREKFGIGG